MKERKISAEEASSFPISPARLAGLLRLAEAGAISAASAKEVFAAMLDSPAEAEAIVAEKGLGAMRDTGALEAIVSEIVAGNPSQVALYRSGQDPDLRLVRRAGHEEDGRPGGSGGPAGGLDAGAGAAPAASREAVIQLFNVSKKYGTFRDALLDVSFHVASGEFVFLTGPSGAGKSTLLRLLFLEEPPTTGQIIVNGRNIGVLPPSQVPYLRRTMGVVFQDFKLIARKTVFENISYVQNVLGLPRAEQKRRAYHVLKRVGLHHQMNAYPDELSGGEQQRVAIARAIVNEPTLLLADEPTGNLDPVLAEEIMRLFVEFNIRGTTVVVATHDLELIRRMGKRTLTLERGRLHDPDRPREAAPIVREAPFLPVS